MYYYYQLLFLFLVSGYAIDDVARFLHDQGLDHLSPNYHAIFSTLAIRTSATPILKSESMQSIQQVGRLGHEGDDG